MSGVFDRLRWMTFRSANLLVRGARRAAGLGDVAIVERRGLRWELELTETIDFSLFLTGRFQRETLTALVGLLREGDTLLDIGANVGAMALPAARALGPNGKVVCFEPTAFGVRKLRRNLELNPDLRDRVDIRQLELVGYPGEKVHGSLHARWPLGRAEGRHAGHHGVEEGCAGATTSTLDDFLEGAGVSRVDAIKLDVDGHECGVLRGARRTLARFRPRMVVELQPSTFDRPAPDRFEDMVDLLREAGYRLRDVVDNKPLPMDATELRRLIPGNSVRNAIAIPAEAA